MPSKIDFNVSPYFDDYDEAKKFHRVIYRPAFAVQARELTTQQSITQNQIEKFGDHVFKHGAMVVPGQVEPDIHYNAVKLTSFNGTLANYNGNTLTGGTSGVVADVVNFVATDGTDPDTLFVKYKNSGTDNASSVFTDGETLTSGHSSASTSVCSTTAQGAAVKIEAGTYYINGFFVSVDEQTLILDKYTNTPSYRVGLTISETFVTSTDDSSLLDNATGSSNANATGAHRFKIELTLAKLSLTSTADASFVELLRLNNGTVTNKVVSTDYSVLEDTLARRTFDESGDYVIRNFDLDPREHLISGTNRGIYVADSTSADGNTASESKLALGLSQGKAYVKGYEIQKHGTTYVDIDKARDFDTASGIVTRVSQLPFVNVTNVFGTPDVGFVSGETEAYKKVRLVSAVHATRGTVQVNNDGTVYDIGRAKSRGVEYNSGTASGVFMSTGSLTSNTYKHYLFDTVMFAHLNVYGPASGALTDGETLTGGTSGATGIVESITELGAATVTGVTQTNPPVVTCSGGHNFLEGQQVKFASVGGMTQLNGNFYTVKNPDATTFQLHDASTSSIGAPDPVDGTGYTAYTSGGTASHTIVILSSVKGIFTEGETATGGSSDNTAVVQFDAFGCKGFEQKVFAQTKGVSMAGSPTYTADVDLTSTFGAHKKLTGTISTTAALSTAGDILLNGTTGASANAGDKVTLEDGTGVISQEAQAADTVFGSGTKFTTELQIGDSITFTDDANNTVTRIVDSIASDTKAEMSTGLGSTTATTVQFTRKRTKIQSPTNDSLIFKLPYNVTKTLLTEDNSGLSDTSFKIRRQFVSTLSSSGTATLTAGTNEIFTAHSEADVTVSVMAKGGSASAGEVGDVITLSSSGDYTLGGSPTGKTLTIDLSSTFNGSKVKILATISASVVGAKTKTATTDVTKTVDTSTLASLTEINLNYADVFNVQSVKMAADFNTAAVSTDLDITHRFDLDTGQRDNFYDVGRLVRKANESAPTGRLLITYDYYAHGAGNFFSVDSYSGISYGDIPSYTSDVTGEKFELRDVLDLRPRVDNASTINAGDGQDRQYSGTGASTVEFAKFNTDITADLEFYLSRRDKVFMASNGDFRVISGASAVEPIEPEGIADAMLLYKMFIPAYTFKTSDIKITPQDNRRYTMRDIGRIEKRLENVEYYTQLSLLEAEAQNMQIQDADGFDRFKNGIIVDNFTGHGIADVTDADYSVSMDMANGELRPAFHQDNINLIESDSSLANSTAMTDAIRTTNGYQKTGDLITLPYTSVSYAEQPYASTTVNLQPFDIIDYVGSVTLTPEMDEWMATETLPDLQVDMPGTFDTLTDLAAQGVLDLNLGTVWGNWNEAWSGSVQETNRTQNTQGGFGWRNRQTTITTEQRIGLRRAGIRTGLIPNAVRTSFGDRVVSVAFAPFIRAKDVAFTGKDLKPLTRVYPFFDGIDVSTYVTPTGSSAGAALTTDGAGEVSGTFAIPDPETSGADKWRTGKRTFRLTTSSTNTLTGDVFTSAESDYTAKGMIQQVQETIVSTREAQVSRTDVQEDQTIVRTNIDTTNTQVWGGSPPHRHRSCDPVAQSFFVDSENGLFITSCQLYFSSKSTNTPVQVQIRTMVNGYPSQTIVPFGQVFVDAADVNTSTDASEATTFTFPSPIFLKENTEYCFVAKANDDTYTMYTAKMGQKTLDGNRLISKQPYFGGMFKSQNGSTWTAEQNEDVKFILNRASFTENTTGTVHLVNDIVPTKTLKQNPLTTTSGSTTVTVHHRNHGMHSTSANVTIAGVVSGTHNGIAHTNLNGTYTTIGNIKLDSYTITAQNSDTASQSGECAGLNTVTATRNILYDVIQPVVGALQPPGTSLSATMRNTTGKTLEGSETEYSLAGTSKAISVTFNEDYYVTAPHLIASAINETNEMSSSKSFNLAISMSTPTDNNNISPIIDTQRLSAFLIQNRLNNPVDGTTPDFVEETTNTGGSASAKYMTRPIILTNDATALDIRVSANVRSTSLVKLYYRVTSAEDARKLGDVAWRGFNDDGTSDTTVDPAKDDVTFKELKFSAGDLTEFTAFQLKVVLTGTNSSYPPILRDMRGIALAL
jgi:hypothetical protein